MLLLFHVFLVLCQSDCFLMYHIKKQYMKVLSEKIVVAVTVV